MQVVEALCVGLAKLVWTWEMGVLGGYGWVLFTMRMLYVFFCSKRVQMVRMHLVPDTNENLSDRSD